MFRCQSAARLANELFGNSAFELLQQRRPLPQEHGLVAKILSPPVDSLEVPLHGYRGLI